MSAQELVSHFKNCLMDDVIIRTDGWRAYRSLVSDRGNMNPLWSVPVPMQSKFCLGFMLSFSRTPKEIFVVCITG